LYAYNRNTKEHEQVSAWLNDSINRGDLIGLPWITIWAFIRIGTNDVIEPNALTVAEALRIVQGLLSRTNIALVEAGPKHLDFLAEVMLASGVKGRSTTDAVLAALAMEHGAALATTDAGMKRFEGLRVVDRREALA
jgi:hypothetical protein